MATPGVTATAVQKAGVAYAEAKNHQYRYEMPSATLTETGAITLVNDTLGRNDFAVMAMPSYGYVADPDGGTEGKRKLVTLTGMIHGREARMAADWDGYHKAQAGTAATLPTILELTTGEAILNEELLNPVGIATIKKVSGNFVIWGDRMLYVDPTWMWKHQREQMSHYEHVLQENFDWIVFAINDAATRELAKVALTSFFLPEWRKRALRGDQFADAAIIKIDDENNTDATMAAGDMHAQISLRLADTVERFIITIGKQGIFDSAG
jgi:phage tail sheath protein FI